MSQSSIKPLLLFVVLLALTVSASAQTKPSAADREKADKERAERFKKFAAYACRTGTAPGHYPRHHQYLR